jgi:hypothetical protein
MYLQPLRYGQQFQLTQAEIGVSPYTDPKEDWLYNLGYYDTTNEIPPGRCREVGPTDQLIAYEVWWAINSGWFVQAHRTTDKRTFTFIQLIDDQLWRRHYPDRPGGQSAAHAITVCNARWPEPSPESLAIAVEAIANERVPGSGLALLPLSVRSLGDLPLEEGVPMAVEILEGWLPSATSARTALRERGFQA